jgi:hypothetical protein
LRLYIAGARNDFILRHLCVWTADAERVIRFSELMRAPQR